MPLSIARNYAIADNNGITPDEAVRLQIRRYRQMTSEERLAVALRLHELACAVAREGIRQQNPGASADEIERFIATALATGERRMTEQELLVDCLRRLNGVGVAYMLTGSMASNYWGIPRTTHDLDFVIQFCPTLPTPDL